MTLHRERSIISFKCDGCEDELWTFTSDFRDALDELKDNGWIVRKIDGEWAHVCPECQENEIELAL